MRCGWCEAEITEAGVTTCPSCKKVTAAILPPDARLQGGRYRIERALGQGGFGITYRARDEKFQRLVAIKEFYPSSYVHRDSRTTDVTYDADTRPHIESGIERFLKEGQNLARVRHPGVPTVHDHFEEHNTAYLVMEFISGQSLESLLRSRNNEPLPEGDVRQIMGKLVDALAAVHDQGLRHLDIKPDNVMLEAGGRVVLIDFGSARQGDSFGTRSLVSLTPRYAPPELFRKDSYGPETDIFELGVLLHRLLTGYTPPSATEREYERRDWEPDPGAIREPWRTMIARAVALVPGDRPHNVRAWWDAADSASPEKPIPAPNSPASVPTEVMTRPMRKPEPVSPPVKNPVPALVMSSIGLLALGVMGFLLLSRPPESKSGSVLSVPERKNTPSPAPTPRPSATPRSNRQATAKLTAALERVRGATPDQLPAIVTAVTTALNSGADPDTTNSDKLTVLHLAAALGRLDLTRAALKRGANVNFQQEDGYTALHLAALSDSAAVIKILREAGADLLLPDKAGMTALDRARKNNKARAAAALRP